MQSAPPRRQPPWPKPPITPPAQGARILGNAGFAMLARILQLSVGFLLLVGVARYLPVTQYGEFGFILTLCASTMAVTYFGLQQTVIKEMSRDPASAAQHLGAGALLRGLLCLLAVGALALSDYLGGSSREIMLATMLCAVGEACRSMAMLSGAVFQAHERMGWEPVLTLAQSVSALALVGAAIWFDWGFLALFAGLAVSLVLQLVASWAVCVTKFLRPAMPSAGMVKAMLAVAVVVGLGIFFNRNLVRVSTLIVKWLEGPEAVAWFQLPHDFILRFGLVPQALMLASFPVFARLMQHDRGGATRLYELIFRYTLAWGPGLSLALAYYAQDLILLLFGERYLPSAPVFQWLAWAITPLALDQLHVNIMVAMDKQKTAMWYTGGVLLACVLGNWAAVSGFGWEAAAIVAPASYVLLAAISTWFVSNYLQAPVLGRLGRLPLGLPLALGLAWGCMHVLSPASKLGALVAAMAAYCGALILTRAMPWREIKQLKAMRRGLRPQPQRDPTP